MTHQQPPIITFPAANYPVKVVGDAGEAYRQFMLQTLSDIIDGFDSGSLSARLSSGGNYCAYTFRFTAQSPEQLQTINERLRLDPRTRTVL